MDDFMDKVFDIILARGQVTADQIDEFTTHGGDDPLNDPQIIYEEKFAPIINALEDEILNFDPTYSTIANMALTLFNEGQAELANGIRAEAERLKVMVNDTSLSETTKNEARGAMKRLADGVNVIVENLDTMQAKLAAKKKERGWDGVAPQPDPNASERVP